MIPTNYCFHWVGGKKQLRDKIYSLMPHKMEKFAEVFCGGCYVLFGKERIAYNEIINDLNGDIINFYRVIQNDIQAFCNKFNFLFHSREQYFEMVKSEPETDIDRAVKFFYVINLSYGGKIDNISFGFPDRAINMENILYRAIQSAKRLKNVVIQNLDFRQFIKEYDCKDMFFYCDPPYVCKKIYNNDEELIHQDLANLLKNANAKFMVSYNDCELVRDLYKDFNIFEVKRQNSLSRQNGDSDYNELIITNYEQDSLFNYFSEEG